jgi:ABC-type sugar transport system ATPase subunit
MNKELLRFEHVTTNYPMRTNLSDFNLVIYHSETVGIVALNEGGISSFLHLLQTNDNILKGNIYITGKLVNSWRNSDQTQNNCLIIDKRNKLTQHLSVTDNLFIVPHSKRKSLLISEKREKKLAQWLFAKYGIDISIEAKCYDLTEVDRCIVEIMRGVVADADIIILDSLNGFLTAHSYKKILALIQELSADGFDFIFIANELDVLPNLINTTVLLQNGKELKTFYKQDPINEQKINRITDEFNKKAIITERKSSFTKTQKSSVITSFINVYTNHLFDFSLPIYSNECVLIQANTKVHEDIIELLAGYQEPISGEILFNGTVLKQWKKRKLYPAGIHFIFRNAYITMPFFDLSYVDNLMIGIQNKTNTFLVNKNFYNIIKKEAAAQIGAVAQSKDIRELSKEDLYKMVYYHAYILKPKLVVIERPFTENDYHTRNLITHLIKVLQECGCSILILSTYVTGKMDLYDKVIKIHNKRIVLD